MMVDQEQQAEIQKLREQIEGCRLREIEDLRFLLAEARAQVAHYRDEANRNAQIGQQIAREGDTERTRLKERISVLEQYSSVRQPRSGV